MTLDPDRVLDEDLAGAGAEGEGPSLRDELAAALAADGGEDASGRAGSDAPATAATPAPAESRARDGHGRFAPPRAEGQAQPQSTTEPRTPQAPAAATPGQAAQAQPSGPPASWSAAAKADFQSLPEHIRQEVLKREGDMERGRAQWQSGAETLNRLTTSLGPRVEKWRMAGFDMLQGVQRLAAAEDFLERDPVNALAQLARSYGVDLRAFAQMQGQQQPREAQLPAPLQGLAQDVETLKQALAQQRQSAEQSTRRGYLDQVAQFAANPANLYFENVREDMARLIQAGAASSLEDAYEKATWAHPEVRPALLRAQAGAQAGEARAKAAQARHASGSVTGSPAPGASPARGGQNPNASVRDDLMAVWNEHA